MSNFVEVPIDEELVIRLMAHTKKELVDKFIISALESKVANNDVIKLQKKLDKAESYIEQGRSMIEAVMERWHEYDV